MGNTAMPEEKYEKLHSNNFFCAIIAFCIHKDKIKGAVMIKLKLIIALIL